MKTVNGRETEEAGAPWDRRDAEKKKKGTRKKKDGILEGCRVGRAGGALTDLSYSSSLLSSSEPDRGILCHVSSSIAMPAARAFSSLFVGRAHGLFASVLARLPGTRGERGDEIEYPKLLAKISA